jgi:hypothetical protein
MTSTGEMKAKLEPKIGRNLAFGEENIEQGADTVHEQTGIGVQLKEQGHQDGSAKHGEQML